MPDPRDCLNCGMCEWCIERSIAAAEEAEIKGPDRHWSELSGEWYYVLDVHPMWDVIRHDVESEDLTDEFAGMFLLRKDGTAVPAPTTRAAWEFLVETTDIDADEPVCVGRVVDGVCVPIGNDGDEEGE